MPMRFSFFAVVMFLCQPEFLKGSPKKIYYKSTVFSWNDFIPELYCSFLKFSPTFFEYCCCQRQSASLVVRILYPINNLRCCRLNPGYGSITHSLRKDDHSLPLKAQKSLLCCVTKFACAYMKYPDAPMTSCCIANRPILVRKGKRVDHTTRVAFPMPRVFPLAAELKVARTMAHNGKGPAASSGPEGKEVVRCRIRRELPTTPHDRGASG